MTKNSFLIILLFSLLFGWQLLRPGYYTMHDDLQVMRLYEMDRCFKDGQLPCRLAPDMGQNYSQPLFNYYSAFPYYLGEALHLLGFSFVDTVKLLFLLSLFLSGLAVYLLASLFLPELPALVAAVAYLAAPYHAVDIFVRGALSESWGLALVPLVLYSLLRLAKKLDSGSALLLAISLFALLTTHNLTSLISAPIFIVFGLYALIKSLNRRRFLFYALSGALLGLGLAAFFLLPVIFEKNLIQTNFLVSDYFDFRAHFVTIGQLFTKLSWGYGPSRFNSWQYPATLSFFVGLLPLFALLAAPVVLFVRRKDKNFPFFLLTYFFFLGFLFLTHARSVFIWERLPLLAYLQFPWRFLGPAALMSSLLVGYLAGKKPLAYLFLVVLVLTNIFYFRFEKYLPNLTDEAKLTGAAYDEQIKGALLDYLPKTSVKIPETKAPGDPQVISGRVNINYYDKRSNYFSSEFDVYSDEAVVVFPITFFPGWQVYHNRAPEPISVATDNDFGQITVKMTNGHHLFQGFFENTLVRTLGNSITFISGLILVFWFIFSQSKKHED